VRDSLAVIEEESDRLADLIDDLLEASRLQSGTPSLSLSDVDLAEIARELAERFRTQSIHHTFEVTLPKEFPIVRADEERLTQVVSNLLSNAIKYASAGGVVQIQGRVAPNEVILCVQDGGPGISPADRTRVFERFFRSAETAQTTQGVGLGLFLAKAVVEAHGGRIWVDEKVERGARICFSIPRERE
jgi:signal transduction histidine kinase